MPWLNLEELNRVQRILVSNEWACTHGLSEEVRSQLYVMQWEVNLYGDLMPTDPRRKPAQVCYDKTWDNKVCVCGDPYERHFDLSEGLDIRGCKYCGCLEFKEQE